MKYNLKYTKINVFVFCFILFFSSCVSTKNVTYFQDLKSRSIGMDSIANYTEPVIKKEDILAINIITADPQSTDVINQAATTQGAGRSAILGRQDLSGFPVDKNGDIELSLVGKIAVAGLTTYEATELIRGKVSKFYQKPSVSVRFAEFKVSVLGEVGRPAIYNMSSERVSVLDVLSLAGDLTLYGRRDNILVIRDNLGMKEFGRLDLNSKNIFNNKYFFLKQNDVVYVEPNKAKVLSLNSTARSTLTIGLSAISTIILIILRVI
jgi:polysaccharide export outer membrane protein